MFLLDQRLLFAVFLIVFVSLLVFCVIYIGTYISHDARVTKFANKTRSFVINLEKNKARLSRFLESYNKSDMSAVKLERFNAIIGKQLDLQNYVTDEAYKQILDAEKNGYRQRHYELTRGAVGCFLSHASIFKKLLKDDKHDFYIIFEDDSYIPPKTIDRLIYFIDNAPKEWDILVFGAIREVLYERGELFDKVKAWWGLFGYVINKKGAQRFLDNFQKHKIDKQIDSEMSMMISENNLNVYSSRIHLISHNTDKTDIQLPIRVQKNIDPFKYGNVELFTM